MNRAPLPCLAFILPLLGCELPCAEGYGRAADGACYPICGTPSLADDSGPLVDSGVEGSSYTGAFFIDVTESGSNATDTCVGQVNVVVNLAASPSIQGDFSCGFNEALSNLPGASGVLTGDVGQDGISLGRVEGIDWLQADWSGTYRDDTLIGVFNGEAREEGYTLTYTGQFNTQPPQE